jgi:malonyl-CoA O-methyltransferase
MLSRRSAEIAASFGARAKSYERHAGLQRAVADRLARLLPERKQPNVLELGCGTGLFSRHLLARYPEGRFVLTDAAPAMIAECRRYLAAAVQARISFEVMDAGEAGGHADLDLIVSSMTLHWLADPAASLERLRRLLAPSGILLYATVGPDSFAEWRGMLAREGLPSGLAEIKPLPGIVEEERVAPDADTLSFLRRMEAVGGLTPKEGYTPLSPGALRRAIRATDAAHGGRITWHIVYGLLSAPDAIAFKHSTMPA